MARFKITKEDMLRSKTVKPGWYTATIISNEAGTAKTDNSAKVTVNLKIKEGEFAGVPLQATFSEKFPAGAVGFVSAALGRKLDDAGWEGDFDPANGRDVRVFVANEQWEGRMINRVKDFEPMAASRTA